MTIITVIITVSVMCSIVDFYDCDDEHFHDVVHGGMIMTVIMAMSMMYSMVSILSL